MATVLNPFPRSIVRDDLYPPGDLTSVPSPGSVFDSRALTGVRKSDYYQEYNRAGPVHHEQIPYIFNDAILTKAMIYGMFVPGEDAVMGIAPVIVTDKHVHQWNVIEFGSAHFGVTPPETASRESVVSERTYKVFSIRRGSAISMELDMINSPEGPPRFKNKVNVLITGARRTVKSIMLQELMMAPGINAQRNPDTSEFRQRTDKYVRDEISSFGLFHRDPVEAKGVLQKYLTDLRALGAMGRIALIVPGTIPQHLYKEFFIPTEALQEPRTHLNEEFGIPSIPTDPSSIVQAGPFTFFINKDLAPKESSAERIQELRSTQTVLQHYHMISHGATNLLSVIAGGKTSHIKRACGSTRDIYIKNNLMTIDRPVKITFTKAIKNAMDISPGILGRLAIREDHRRGNVTELLHNSSFIHGKPVTPHHPYLNFYNQFWPESSRVSGGQILYDQGLDIGNMGSIPLTYLDSAIPSFDDEPGVAHFLIDLVGTGLPISPTAFYIMLMSFVSALGFNLENNLHIGTLNKVDSTVTYRYNLNVAPVPASIKSYNYDVLATGVVVGTGELPRTTTANPTTETPRGYYYRHLQAIRFIQNQAFLKALLGITLASQNIRLVEELIGMTDLGDVPIPEEEFYKVPRHKFVKNTFEKIQGIKSAKDLAKLAEGKPEGLYYVTKSNGKIKVEPLEDIKSLEASKPINFAKEVLKDKVAAKALFRIRDHIQEESADAKKGDATFSTFVSVFTNPESKNTAETNADIIVGAAAKLDEIKKSSGDTEGKNVGRISWLRETFSRGEGSEKRVEELSDLGSSIKRKKPTKLVPAFTIFGLDEGSSKRLNGDGPFVDISKYVYESTQKTAPPKLGISSGKPKFEDFESKKRSPAQIFQGLRHGEMKEVMGKSSGEYPYGVKRGTITGTTPSIFGKLIIAGEAGSTYFASTSGLPRYEGGAQDLRVMSMFPYATSGESDISYVLGNKINRGYLMSLALTSQYVHPTVGNLRGGPGYLNGLGIPSGSLLELFAHILLILPLNAKVFANLAKKSVYIPFNVKLFRPVTVECDGCIAVQPGEDTMYHALGRQHTGVSSEIIHKVANFHFTAYHVFVLKMAGLVRREKCALIREFIAGAGVEFFNNERIYEDLQKMDYTRPALIAVLAPLSENEFRGMYGITGKGFWTKINSSETGVPVGREFRSANLLRELIGGEEAENRIMSKYDPEYYHKPPTLIPPFSFQDAQLVFDIKGKAIYVEGTGHLSGLQYTGSAAMFFRSGIAPSRDKIPELWRNAVA